MLLLFIWAMKLVIEPNAAADIAPITSSSSLCSVPVTIRPSLPTIIAPMMSSRSVNRCRIVSTLSLLKFVLFACQSPYLLILLPYKKERFSGDTPVPFKYRFCGTPPSGASGGRKSGDTPETPPGAAPLDPAFKIPLLVSTPVPPARGFAPCTPLAFCFFGHGQGLVVGFHCL